MTLTRKSILAYALGGLATASAVVVITASTVGFADSSESDATGGGGPMQAVVAQPATDTSLWMLSDDDDGQWVLDGGSDDRYEHDRYDEHDDHDDDEHDDDDHDDHDD